MAAIVTIYTVRTSTRGASQVAYFSRDAMELIQSDEIILDVYKLFISLPTIDDSTQLNISKNRVVIPRKYLYLNLEGKYELQQHGIKWKMVKITSDT